MIPSLDGRALQANLICALSEKNGNAVRDLLAQCVKELTRVLSADRKLKNELKALKHFGNDLHKVKSTKIGSEQSTQAIGKAVEALNKFEHSMQRSTNKKVTAFRDQAHSALVPTPRLSTDPVPVPQGAEASIRSVSNFSSDSGLSIDTHARAPIQKTGSLTSQSERFGERHRIGNYDVPPSRSLRQASYESSDIGLSPTESGIGSFDDRERKDTDQSFQGVLPRSRQHSNNYDIPPSRYQTTSASQQKSSYENTTMLSQLQLEMISNSVDSKRESFAMEQLSVAAMDKRDNTAHSSFDTSEPTSQQAMSQVKKNLMGNLSTLCAKPDITGPMESILSNAYWGADKATNMSDLQQEVQHLHNKSRVVGRTSDRPMISKETALFLEETAPLCERPYLPDQQAII